MSVIPIEEYLPDQICLHPDVQVRVQTDEDAVARYCAMYTEGQHLPLITVCFCAEDGKTYIVDGHHRFEAMKMAEISPIQAYSLGSKSLAEMISLSIKANCEHGLALTRADRKRAVQILCKYNPAITARDAAQQVGLSKSLVAMILKDYRDQSTVTCAFCKKTANFLTKEGLDQNWLNILYDGKKLYFCCEEHRREFYARHQEEANRKKAERELEEVEEVVDEETHSEDISLVDSSNISTLGDDREYTADAVKGETIDIPCPFCGAHGTPIYSEYYKQYSIQCHNPQCSVRPTTFWFPSMSQAVQVWDTTRKKTYATQLENFLRKGYTWQLGSDMTFGIQLGEKNGQSCLLVVFDQDRKYFFGIPDLEKNHGLLKKEE